ncbi:pseudouridine synthase [Azohydromonas lata]|uniref:pseudouridine synthase n=1 Tax=Azohydromonas lata TaxID=45677 RepID=UPI000A04C056|nr:pseudouridine synthase [Azohydromonas lata]
MSERPKIGLKAGAKTRDPRRANVRPTARKAGPPPTAAERAARDEQRSHGDRPARQDRRDDAPRGPRRDAGDRPRRPDDRGGFSNDRPRHAGPREDRPRRDDRPQRDDRGGFHADRPQRDDRGSFHGDRPRRDERPAFGDRDRGGFGGPGRRDERPQRPERGGFHGDRPQREERGGFHGDRPRRDERPAFGERDRGGFGGPGRRDERGGFGDRPQRPERPERGGFHADRPQREERGGFHGERPRRDERPAFGDRGGFGGPGRRDERGGFGDRPQRPERPERGGFHADRPQREEGGGFHGDRPRRDERPAFGDRDRGGFGDRLQRPERGGFHAERAARDERPAFNRRSPAPGQPVPQRRIEADEARSRSWDAPARGEDDDAEPAAVAQGVRLSKHLSEQGLVSRREADDWIDAGWVKVDGKMAVLGQRLMPGQVVEIDDAARQAQAKRVTILINKPIGYVSGQAEDGYEPAAVLVTAENHWSEDPSRLRFHPGHGRHLAPAGRLDIDSTGLLVLTQDGRIAKQLIGDETKVEKEYLVRVEYQHPGRLPDRDLELLRHGLELDGKPLKPAQVSWQNEDQLRVVLREGRKRQIRRMCEAVGLKVVGLKRVRIGSVVLGKLPPGQWRYLGDFEKF